MTLTLRELTDSEYRTWSARGIETYAQDLVASNRADPEHAIEMARSSYESLLPRGLETPRHSMFRAVDGAEPVGWLWVGLGDQASRPQMAWVYDVEIEEAFQGRGLGRALMRLAERVATEAGFTEIGLNVFGFNHRARGLYESLGYSTTAVQMAKELPR